MQLQALNGSLIRRRCELCNNQFDTVSAGFLFHSLRPVQLKRRGPEADPLPGQTNTDKPFSVSLAYYLAN